MEPTHVGSHRALKESLKQTRLHRRCGHSALGFSALALALPLLFAALPAGADTSFTTTNWMAGVPVPGIQYTNSSGLVYLKGNVHIHRVLSSDARIAGRLTAWMDLAYQADGSALLVGAAYVEPGNWDATGTNFTPSGGVWDLKYDGVVQLDGSDQIHLVGYGNGGTIEGLRMECTATKGPGAPFDPAIPYFASGTIKPAPINTRAVLDDFADNHFTWTSSGAGAGIFAAVETNQQLTIRGTWNSPTLDVNNWCAWANPWHAWAVQPGQTVEARVDLASFNQAATAVGLCIYHVTGQAYLLTVARDWIMIGKQYWPGTAWYRLDKATITGTNAVLVLALTPVGQNVVLTGKVLDKASSAVLHQISIVDTPASDPTLTQAELAQLTGCRPWNDVITDPSGAPWTSGDAPLLAVFQDTDGTKPPAEATFDNLEMRTYEVPQVGIERAVQLTWPATGMNFAVEAAPTLQGPWLPLNNTLLPGMQQITVPVNKSAEFFRLQQVP